jgi:membrane protease YdiL (CAAX protease family)
VGLHAWNPAIFNLGYPKAIESVRFLVVGIIAPIGEELAFRQGIFKTALRDNKRLGLIPAIIITSIAFAAFHAVAYGLATAAYLGAGFFSVLACWITEKTGDMTAALVMHMIINIALISMSFVVIGV